MGEGKIRTGGMISHTFPFERVSQVFEMIAARKEPFFKIMFTLGD
jgi:threonine dehydrogenase-like Zn-dependent dehydrogenase